MKIISILIISMLSLLACAEEGYVYVGDLNGDGVADTLESGPSSTFGNAGGAFVVTIMKSGDIEQKSYLISGHPMAFAIEETPNDEIKLWTYWHMSGREGVLSSSIFTPEGIKIERITINPGDGGTKMGNAIYKSVFNDKHLIKMENIKNYTAPPNPSGLEWGK